MALQCPVSPPAFWREDKDKDKKEKKDAKQSTKSSRKVPWVAFGGLTLVALLTLLAVGLSVTLIITYFSNLLFIISLPFKALGALLSTFVWWPLKFLFSLLPIGYPAAYSPALANQLHCNNFMELQGWEVLSIFPGGDGNPKPIKYELNSPTPHAVSVIDIDYRDTRLDVFANGEYYGSTSDFVLDKMLFCGEDLNECIQKGFSTGTIIIPAGKQSVEIAWSGKDVFPGTDKIVWGADRKRRVMWKKELCL